MPAMAHANDNLHAESGKWSVIHARSWIIITYVCCSGTWISLENTGICYQICLIYTYRTKETKAIFVEPSLETHMLPGMSSSQIVIRCSVAERDIANFSRSRTVSNVIDRSNIVTVKSNKPGYDQKKKNSVQNVMKEWILESMIVWMNRISTLEMWRSYQYPHGEKDVGGKTPVEGKCDGHLWRHSWCLSGHCWTWLEVTRLDDGSNNSNNTPRTVRMSNVRQLYWPFFTITLAVQTNESRTADFLRHHWDLTLYSPMSLMTITVVFDSLLDQTAWKPNTPMSSVWLTPLSVNSLQQRYFLARKLTLSFTLAFGLGAPLTFV